MFARGTVVQIVAKAGMLLGALCVVTVLLAAIPSHRPPAAQVFAQDSTTPPADVDHGSMPGMDMSDEHASEKAAVRDMTPGHHDAHSQHMTMSAMREQTPEDTERAKEVVAQLRAGIEKYRDYRVALNDGFKIFLPNIPQPEYHFTSYRNGFLEALAFDPARPTSLLYRKTSSGYELVGAMYTMPQRATEEQLNARVPLSVAMWHLHTNLCMPPRAQLHNADWTRFRPERVDCHAWCLRCSWRALPGVDLWLDGARVSVRGFIGQSFCHAPSHGLISAGSGPHPTPPAVRPSLHSSPRSRDRACATDNR